MNIKKWWLRAARYLSIWMAMRILAGCRLKTIKSKKKRDRKIINKAELTRLQQNFEDCMKQIDGMEKSKHQTAVMAALTIGLIGTAFMAGATFAAVNQPPIVWLCILMAIPGFMGWITPYFVYNFMLKKRNEMVAPLIEAKYEEIHTVCEKGNHLLGNG